MRPPNHTHPLPWGIASLMAALIVVSLYLTILGIESWLDPYRSYGDITGPIPSSASAVSAVTEPPTQTPPPTVERTQTPVIVIFPVVWSPTATSTQTPSSVDLTATVLAKTPQPTRGPTRTPTLTPVPTSGLDEGELTPGLGGEAPDG